MKLSDYIVKFLKQKGVGTVFGYQGGAITHLVDSIYKANGIEFLSTYHEQAAAFAAEGYSRITGNIGVAIATSGPGATNLITGIGSAFFDSIPCLYITGQVNTYEYKRNEKIRQEGFQETDIVSIVKPITKYATIVKDENKIKYYLEKAFFIAKVGRPGPVLLDIPMNIQRANVNMESLESFYDSDEFKSYNRKNIKEEDMTKVIELLKDSKRPVILVGGGVRMSDSCNLLWKICNKLNVPVVSTLMGLDCLPHDNSNYIGFMGAYGSRYSNLTVANSDLLLVLGSRLTSRQTSTLIDSFAREAKVIHVDIDENELNRKVKEYISIQCDIKIFLNKLYKKIENTNFNADYSEWISKVNNYKLQYPSYPTQKDINSLDPNEFMHNLSYIIGENTIICLDVGQNQIWASQSLKLKKNCRLLNSGGMGAMGFALPAAIGAYTANPNAKVIAIAGDGGVQMNIQELQTLIRENMQIKIIIMNNNALGMIRHFQEMYFQSNYFGTVEGYSSPDFCQVGKAYGIHAIKINGLSEMNKLAKELMSEQSSIIEIKLNSPTYVIPKLAMGRPIEDQDPLVDRNEFEKNMIIRKYK